MPDSLAEQLTAYLTDAHSIEEQALRQLRAAPGIAGDPGLAEVFDRHLIETEDQERRVRERLEAREADPSRLKDLLGRAGGAGMVAFARAQPDTPGKLTAHAFSYEHLEAAAYDLLALVARRAGDDETVAMARDIGDEERAMAERLAANFDRAVDASLAELEPDDVGEQLVTYLADAHAIEAQAIELLEKGPGIAGESNLAAAFVDHLEETRGHQDLVASRLQAHDASPAALKDLALRAGALNLGAFFGAQPDTPTKLAGFAFAFEHLEIAAYELLARVAQLADDEETVRAAGKIAGEERAAAERIHGHFPEAVDAALAAQGVAA